MEQTVAFIKPGLPAEKKSKLLSVNSIQARILLLLCFSLKRGD